MHPVVQRFHQNARVQAPKPALFQRTTTKIRSITTTPPWKKNPFAQLGLIDDVNETRLGVLGDTTVTDPTTDTTTTTTGPTTDAVAVALTAYEIGYGLIDTASIAASAYHGYKRNDSVGWAVVWGLMGGLFPIITPAIAIAQGFAKPEK